MENYSPEFLYSNGMADGTLAKKRKLNFDSKVLENRLQRTLSEEESIKFLKKS